MQLTSENDQRRLRDLADRLDCFTEGDVMLLTDVTPNTLEAWNKRGTGPEYFMVGKRRLYPRDSFGEFLETRRRKRNVIAAKSVL